MESLLTYASTDSEPDVDDDRNLNVESQSQDSEMKLNFFGLDVQSSTPFTPITKKMSDNKVSKQKQEGESSSLDIPDGHFWKDFRPDSTIDMEIVNSQGLTQEQRPSKLTPLESKSEGNIKKRSFPIHHPSKSITDEKRFCSSRLNSKYDALEQKDTFTQHSKVGLTQEEKRKIFYVHSKVSPYLTSHSACKCASKQSSSWRGHNQAINRLMWNRSNYSHLLLTAGMDSEVKVWNVWSCLDRCVSTITHHSKAVRNAIWGKQGRSIISCGYDKMAIVTDVESGTMQSRHIHQGFVVACTLHPNNPNCFVTGTENLIQFWDLRTPLSPIKALTYKDDMGQPQDLLFIQGGNELISCSDIVSRDSADRTIMAWDVKSGNVISNQIYQERYTCTRLKKTPSNSHFLAQTQGGYVALFSTTRPYKIDKNKRFEGHEMQGYNIGFDVSYDGSLLYSGSAQGGIHCYDYRSGRLIRKCADDQNDVVTDVACHPVLSNLIASCTWGGRVSLWQ